MTPLLTVIIPTHNPHLERLRRTLSGLRAQTLPDSQWETIIVDNASQPPVASIDFADVALANVRVILEPQLGLTAARRRGFTAARGEVVVMVDDDNVLAPDYLQQALALFTTHPWVGALGGKSLPEFESAPPAWVREFDDLIACRELGDTAQVSSDQGEIRAARREYPRYAPIGAGMALRREAAQLWLADNTAPRLSDRRGGELTSGGDNDIILTLIRHGWGVGYFPALRLTHLIPASRMTRDYLARLNHGIAQSWIQVLSKHEVCPWGPIPHWTVPLRKLKTWFAYRAWAGPAAYVRWQGACGHFEGRAAVRPPTVSS